jgi:hypothetical protein
VHLLPGTYKVTIDWDPIGPGGNQCFYGFLTLDLAKSPYLLDTQDCVTTEKVHTEGMITVLADATYSVGARLKSNGCGWPGPTFSVACTGGACKAGSPY